MLLINVLALHAKFENFSFFHALPFRRKKEGTTNSAVHALNMYMWCIILGALIFFKADIGLEDYCLD